MAVLPLVYFFFSKKVGNFFTIIVMILIMISTKRSSFLALLLGIFVYYISDAIVQKTSRKKLNKMLSLMLMVVIVSVVGLYLINTSDIEIFQRFTSEDTTLSEEQCCGEIYSLITGVKDLVKNCSEMECMLSNINLTHMVLGGMHIILL